MSVSLIKEPKPTIGDVVEVQGYGGLATILTLEEDGVAPNGSPKYVATVRFGQGVNNAGARTYEFPLGKLSFPTDGKPKFSAPIDDMSEAELIEHIANLKAKLAGLVPAQGQSPVPATTAQAPAPQFNEWVGECSFCGEEVPIFGHENCPALSNDSND